MALYYAPILFSEVPLPQEKESPMTSILNQQVRQAIYTNNKARACGVRISPNLYDSTSADLSVAFDYGHSQTIHGLDKVGLLAVASLINDHLGVNPTPPPAPVPAKVIPEADMKKLASLLDFLAKLVPAGLVSCTADELARLKTLFCS